MLKCLFAKIKGLFCKKNKQNSIRIDSMKNGDIYQDSVVTIENPAIAINHIKDNPGDLKLTRRSATEISTESKGKG